MRKIPIFALFLLAACTKSGFVADSGSLDSGSLDNIGSGNGNGAVAITFTAPSPTFLAEAPFAVKLTADPLSELRELKLFVNDIEHTRFTRVPFEAQIDPSAFPGCELTIRAQALDRSQRYSSRVLKLKKYAQCEPNTPGNSPPSSKTAGTFDPNCLNNNSYDACIFWKNPVAQKGASYSPAINFGATIAEQSFGVKLTGLTNPGRLENATISVGSSRAPDATPTGGHWRYAYKDDGSNHFVAQLMAYFWLSYQENQMLSRSGKFYASRKGINVDAFNTGVTNNAYWDGQRIVMGVASLSGAQHEMALSAEVYLHEMGHANLQFAVGRFLQDNNAGSNSNTCATASGCIGAINEGQADFHFLMLFSESSALGETFVNNVNGISQNGISRDVRKLSAMKAPEFFSRSSGEIHGMGSFYASVLWEIYNNPGMKKLDFERLFTAHLTMLTESTRFPEARDALIAQDANLFSGKYKNIILQAFEAKGIL